MLIVLTLTTLFLIGLAALIQRQQRARLAKMSAAERREYDEITDELRIW
jgi:hypothetical protein